MRVINPNILTNNNIIIIFYLIGVIATIAKTPYFLQFNFFDVLPPAHLDFFSIHTKTKQLHNLYICKVFSIL